MLRQYHDGGCPAEEGCRVWDLYQIKASASKKSRLGRLSKDKVKCDHTYHMIFDANNLHANTLSSPFETSFRNHWSASRTPGSQNAAEATDILYFVA